MQHSLGRPEQHPTVPHTKPSANQAALLTDGAHRGTWDLSRPTRAVLWLGANSDSHHASVQSNFCSSKTW